MRKQFLIAAIICFVLFGLTLNYGWGATYYVIDLPATGCADNNVGSATVDGTDYNEVDEDCNGGGTSSYYTTIADVNAAAATTEPGDFISFNKGGIWREQLTVPESGSDGLPITYTSHGTGDAPIISGADVEESWTLEAFDTEDFTDGTGDKPISWWVLDETSGTRLDANTTSNNDLTASGNDPAHTTGPNGVTDAVLFTSANSENLTSTNANLSATFPGQSTAADVSMTAGSWVRRDSGTSAGLMNKRGHSWALYYQSNKYHFGVWNDAHALQDSYSDGDIGTEVWVHITGRWVIGSGEVSIFVNGVKQTATATAATMSQDTDYFMIGGSSTWGYLNGAIASPFVFNVALTDAQILDIYNGQISGLTLNTYYSTAAANPNTVIEDGTAYRTIATDKTTLPTGSFWFDDPNNRVYIRTTGDDAPSNYTIEVPTRDYGILLSAKDYVTLQDLYLTGAKDRGINITGAVNTPIMNQLTVINNAFYGIVLDGNSGTIQNVTISNSDVSYQGKAGINGSGTITNSLYSTNTLHHNAQQAYGTAVDTAGIYLYATGVTGAISEYNTVYSNGTVSDNEEAGYGLWYDTIGSGGIIRYNKIYSNSKAGIQVERSSGVKVLSNVVYDNTYGQITLSRDIHNNLVYNNTCYGPGPFGIYVRGDESPIEGGTTGNILRNNISIGSDINLRVKWGGENDGTYGSGNVYDHNCLGAEGDIVTHLVEWGAGNYDDTYDDWETAYGVTTSSVESDPLMTDPANGDFTLQSGSPAIDAGALLSIHVDGWTDYAGATRIYGQLPDIGAYEREQETLGFRKFFPWGSLDMPIYGPWYTP